MNKGNVVYVSSRMELKCITYTLTPNEGEAKFISKDGVCRVFSKSLLLPHRPAVTSNEDKVYLGNKHTFVSGRNNEV